MLEMLLWLVGRYSEQGAMLHVCSKAFRRRPFGMTSSEVGVRRARRAVGGAWRDSATMCYSGAGAGRSGGVLPGPVAPGPRSAVIPPLPRAGVREHHAPVGALRPARRGLFFIQDSSQGAPRTCRCIETLRVKRTVVSQSVREHHAPVGALRLLLVSHDGSFLFVREHHAPVGALRQHRVGVLVLTIEGSGSTTHL